MIMTKHKGFAIEIADGEDGFLIASVPSLKGRHTQGRSVVELMENVRDIVDDALGEGWWCFHNNGTVSSFGVFHDPCKYVGCCRQNYSCPVCGFGQGGDPHVDCKKDL